MLFLELKKNSDFHSGHFKNVQNSKCLPTFNSKNMSSFFLVPFFQFKIYLVLFFQFNRSKHPHNSCNQKPKHNHLVLFQEKHIHPRYNLACNYMVKANNKTNEAKHSNYPIIKAVYTIPHDYDV